MNLVHFVRVVRWLGWVAAAASVGIVLVALVYESIGGPHAVQDWWPAARIWRQLQTTVWMAGASTLLAFLLALPAVLALTQTAPGWPRRLLSSMIVVPLVTMPGVFAYAWMLLSTKRQGIIAKLLGIVGWNTPGLEALQSAWVMATWLWPIPALVMAASFEHGGRVGYQLARLDASVTAAFLRGALPMMRAPILAALGITLILSTTDSTVPPLMAASDVWAVEMMAQASTSARFDRPVGYLFWQAWPMLALIALVVLATLPGLRAMAQWGESHDLSDLDGATTAPGGNVDRSKACRPGITWVVSFLLAAGITIFPIVVFAIELGSGRSSLTDTLSTAARTIRNDGLATLIVGFLTGLFACCISTAAIIDPDDGWAARLAARVLTAGAIVTAVLPPELTGTALATFYSRISDPLSRWSVYDCTPWPWTAAMLARYAFLPVCVANLLNRRIPEGLLGQARMDGTTGLGRIAHVRLPLLALPLVAAAMLSGCMAISEVASSVLVQPPRFFGGSLAVKVDMQMHYGRQDETIAMSMMLIVPAMLSASAVLMLLRGRSRLMGR